MIRWIAAALLAAAISAAAKPGAAQVNAQGMRFGGAFDLAAGAIVLKSLTANAILTGNGTGQPNAVAITGLVKGNGASAPSAYAGTNCTNQFVRSLNASGAATCASVANADLAGSIAASKLIGTDITTLGTITAGIWNGSVIAGQYGGTGVANTGKTITLGGNLATSGAFAATLTLTGATNVTLPTSGTLATLAGSETLTNKTLTDPIVPGYTVSATTLTKTSDTTLEAIPGLAIALTAGKTYSCRGRLVGTSSAAGGIKVFVSNGDTLSATSLNFTGRILNGTTIVARGNATTLGAGIGSATAVYTDYYIDGSIVVNAAGTLILKAAQNASDATSTTVLAGSTFSCVRTN